MLRTLGPGARGSWQRGSGPRGSGPKALAANLDYFQPRYTKTSGPTLLAQGSGPEVRPRGMGPVLQFIGSRRSGPEARGPWPNLIFALQSFGLDAKGPRLGARSCFFPSKLKIRALKSIKALTSAARGPRLGAPGLGSILQFISKLIIRFEPQGKGQGRGPRRERKTSRSIA